MKISLKYLILAVAASHFSASSIAGQINCSPATLGTGDKLTITLAQPLPDIAVITPKKLAGVNFFMLNEIGSGLVQSDQLVSQRKVVIDVDSAKLDGKNRLFFTPGTYEFAVSKNLETDDGTPIHKCKVKFTGVPKP